MVSMWSKRNSTRNGEAADAESPRPQVPVEVTSASGGASPSKVGSDASCQTKYDPRSERSHLIASIPTVAPPLDSLPDAAQLNQSNGVPSPSSTLEQTPQGTSAGEAAFSLAFARVVSILMRSPHYKHYSLSDLEWLVVPPLLSGQCAVMDARIDGKQVPVAAALWANVSEDVDKRLTENLTSPIKLRPDEWRSGDILWLIDAVGEAGAIPQLLKEVQATVFRERVAKVRSAGPDTRPTIQHVNFRTPPSVANNARPLG